MSTPRYNWWPFALNAIRDYPARKAELQDLHKQKVTASMGGIPGGGGASRTTEVVALRQLPEQEQKEYDAVAKALDMQRTMPKARIRNKVITGTLFQNRYTIAGAALWLNIPESEARRYRWEFVMMVGCAFGFLSPEELKRRLDERRDHSGTPKAKNL